MGQLKLIKNEDLIKDDEDSKAKIPPSNPQDKVLHQLAEYATFFINRKGLFPEEDHSKCFLIFAYNYYELGLLEKGQEMLKEVHPQYFPHNFMRDLDEALSFQNKGDECKRQGLELEAENNYKQSEFLLVAFKILNILDDGAKIIEHPDFQKFLEKLQGQEIKLTLAPFRKS